MKNKRAQRTECTFLPSSTFLPPEWIKWKTTSHLFTLFLFCSHAFSVLWKALLSCRYFLPSMRTCPQGPHFMSIFIIWMDKWVRRNESVYAYMACMCVYTYMCERAWLHACIACLLCVCLQFKNILRISINQTMTWGLIKDHKGLTIRATGGNASP